MQYRLCLVLIVATLTFAGHAQATPATTDQLNQFMGAASFGHLGPNEQNILSQNLSSEDVSAYLDFTKSDQGQRYQAFNAQANALSNDSMKAMMAGKVTAPTSGVLSKDQIDKCSHFLLQATNFQMLEYMRAHDKSDDGVTENVMMQLLLTQYPEQIAALYEKYKGDQPAFEKYNQSQAAQDIMGVTLKIVQQSVKDKTPVH